jgi:uncharacterized protein YbjQ (UPF0145 family)
MSAPYRTGEPRESRPVVVTTSTGADLPGYRVVQVLGVVRGVAVRREAAPGETAIDQAIAVRRGAELRLVEEARRLGADAVIAMRYDSNDTEIVAYGTAVRLQHLE